MGAITMRLKLKMSVSKVPSPDAGPIISAKPIIMIIMPMPMNHKFFLPMRSGKFFS